MNKKIENTPDVKNAFLSCSIQSFFADERYLIPVINQLHQKGYYTIGDIASAKSMHEIFKGIRTTRQNRQRFCSALLEGFVELAP